MKKLVLFIALFILCSTAFARDGVDSLISPGELAKAHARYEGITNCTQCHKLGGGVPDGKCLECHDKLAKRIKSGEGIHAKFKGECVKCHSDHRGKSYKMITVDKENFEHDRTDYLLRDKHAKVACVKCHKNEKEGVYTGASKECAGCHNDEHKKQLSQDCSKCHSVKGWKDIAKFDHKTGSAYSLTGKHMEVKCAKCHEGGRYKPVKNAGCLDCHKDTHKGQYPGKSCESCHSTRGWKTLTFDHNSPEYKGYRLDGRHLKVACEKCHTNGRFKNLSYKKCDDCHKDEHKGQFK
ncbi:MAG: hypothetical protein HY889_06220, partial [Deltaproteobacteria bacterium]|nr:hypothetical protein [Deltaproteobacteria bacterium]